MQCILPFFCRIHDVDNDGVIDQDEMKKVFEVIYDIIGTNLINRTIVTPDTRSKNIFLKNGSCRLWFCDQG